MDILGAVTGGLGSVFDNIIPIAAVLGIGALLTSQGVDVVGNVAGFANNAVGSFLNMLDGIGQDQTQDQAQDQAQAQEQTAALEEAYGKDFEASQLTKEEQKGIINDILMRAGYGDTPDTILNKAAERLHLTDEQKESARGIVNDVYGEMYQIKNLGRDREDLVEEALNLAEEKGLFEVIGNNQSISEQTVSQETAQAATPVNNTQPQTQSKTQEKAKNVEPER